MWTTCGRKYYTEWTIKINGEIVFGTWANFLMHFSNYLQGASLDILHQDLLTNSYLLLISGDNNMIFILYPQKIDTTPLGTFFNKKINFF